MAGTPPWTRLVEPVLSIGAYPGEPDTQRAERRVFIVAVIVATLLRIPTVFSSLSATCGATR